MQRVVLTHSTFCPLGHVIHIHVWEVVQVHTQASKQRTRRKKTTLLLCYMGLLQVGYLQAHFWRRY